MRRVDETKLRAERTAPSHVCDEAIGEYPTRRTPAGVSTTPLGSNINVAQSRRDDASARTTSSFVEVAMTERDVVKRLGMMSDDVLPLRDGPSARTDRCDDARATP